MSRVLPILFNTEMVRAILDGRKTTTRRCVKFLSGKNPKWTGYVKDGLMLYNGRNEPCCQKPPYQKGDILYVRETYCPNYFDFVTQYENRHGYKADYNRAILSSDITEPRWTPSIHMPKEAARIWLKVKDVIVERLQYMTLDDFLSEGVAIRPEAFNDPDNAYLQAREAFIDIWNSTIKKTDVGIYDWQSNPWTWTIEFERCEKPEPCILKGIEPAQDKRPCLGYGRTEDDDEPCEMCKSCRMCSGNDEFEQCEKPEGEQ